MKLYLINLIVFGLQSEWGYWGYLRCNQPNSIYEYASETEIQQIKNIIKDKNNKVVLHAVRETWSADAVNYILEQLGVTPELENVKLVVDPCMIDWKPNNLVDFPTNYYNTDLMKVANYEDAYGCNKIIDLSTNRFLYLMGKPYKVHRIGLLRHLHRADLLQHCDWSFTLYDSIYQKTRNILAHLSDDEFTEFVHQTTRTLDNITILGENNNNYFYEGIPYDHSMYEKTSFSLISETMIMPKCITEKTWRTIANRHAFVTLGNTEVFEYMNNIGIDTFDYLHVHESSNFNIAATMSVRNALEKIQDFEKETKRSIESNYNNYRTLVSNKRKQFDLAIEPYLTQPHPSNISILSIIEGEDARRAIDKLWCCW